MSVAIVRIVTDKEIRVLLSQKLWRTQVTISTRWVWRTECCYGNYWDGKSCINVAIVTQWRIRVDVCVTDSYLKHFIVPHIFFQICFWHFICFLVCNSFGKRSRNAAFAASIDLPVWNWSNDSTNVRHKFNVANLSWIKLWSIWRQSVLFFLDGVIRICVVDMLVSIYPRFNGEIAWKCYLLGAIVPRWKCDGQFLHLTYRQNICHYAINNG